MSNSLGQKIRMIRKEKGFSLQKLAEMSAVSKSYIWQLENSNTPNPTIYKLEKLSQSLGVTVDYLTNPELTDEIVTEEILKELFFRKFNQLTTNDRKRIEQIIELWSKECPF